MELCLKYIISILIVMFPKVIPSCGVNTGKIAVKLRELR